MASAIALLAVMALAVAAPQQTVNGPPNALQGFSRNRDQPIKIDAASLEVRDKEKVATFAGKVELVQGDTVLNCQKLVVFYDAEGKTAMAAKDTTAGQQNIRRIEVLGDVVVTQKDQKASAEKGVFDMKTNTITLVGNVVISQGQNVIRGDRLIVDMTTSVSRVECDKSSSCRVQALLMPGGGKNDGGPNLGAARNDNNNKPRSLSPFSQ
ncbi:MAG: lipopolysaccharide transport periplasmic protein LptA [Xanthobacteraceae bacterium]